MNRDILFRGLRIDGGGWIQGDYLSVGGNNIIVRENTEYDPAVLYTKVIPETVGQFTGKHDSAGNKIFEGDEVEFELYGLKKAVVSWNKRASSFVLCDPSYGKEFTRLSGRGKLKLTGRTIHDKLKSPN